MDAFPKTPHTSRHRQRVCGHAPAALPDHRQPQLARPVAPRAAGLPLRLGHVDAQHRCLPRPQPPRVRRGVGERVAAAQVQLRLAPTQRRERHEQIVSGARPPELVVVGAVGADSPAHGRAKLQLLLPRAQRGRDGVRARLVPKDADVGVAAVRVSAVLGVACCGCGEIVFMSARRMPVNKSIVIVRRDAPGTMTTSSEEAQEVDLKSYVSLPGSLSRDSETYLLGS